MQDLLDLDRAGLADLLAGWGQPAFRAKQLHGWLYERGEADFGAMLNLPAALRQRLSDEATAGTLQVATEQTSRDGTIKRLYRLPDGQLI